MKIFSIIKNNKVAMILFIIICLLIIFNQVIYYVINEKFFKSNKLENNDENSKESFINLFNKDSNSLFLDKKFIDNLKKKHDEEYPKYKLNTYPNLDFKRANEYFNETKFLPECCIHNYEFSSSNGCPCITPEQNYYLQFRANNKNKNKNN